MFWIVLFTLIWVIALIVCRERGCMFWRKNTRREECKTCGKACPCRDESAPIKPCSTYTGPERRRTTRRQIPKP